MHQNSMKMYTYLSPTTGKLSCVDLCLTSPNLTAITHMETGTDIGSHHRAIKITVQVKPESYEIIRTRRYLCFNKEELQKFKLDLSVQKDIEVTDVSAMNKQLTEKICWAAERNITKSKTTKVRTRSTPWWNENCSRAVAERRVARRKLEKNLSPKIFRAISKKLSKLKKYVKKAKGNLFKNM